MMTIVTHRELSPGARTGHVATAVRAAKYMGSHSPRTTGMVGRTRASLAGRHRPRPDGHARGSRVRHVRQAGSTSPHALVLLVRRGVDSHRTPAFMCNTSNSR